MKELYITNNTKEESIVGSLKEKDKHQRRV